MMILFFIDEDDELRLFACNYFKKKPEVNHYNHFLIKLIEENYALPIISGGLSDNFDNLLSNSEKDEPNQSEVDINEPIWLSKMIIERELKNMLSRKTLQNTIENIFTAMIDYLDNKRNSYWSCIQPQCLVKQTRIKYESLKTSAKLEEQYEMLYQRLFEPLIKQCMDEPNSPYLPIIRKFCYQSQRFITFDQSLAQHKNMANRLSDDSNIEMSTFQPKCP